MKAAVGPVLRAIVIANAILAAVSVAVSAWLTFSDSPRTMVARLIAMILPGFFAVVGVILVIVGGLKRQGGVAVAGFLCAALAGNTAALAMTALFRNNMQRVFPCASARVDGHLYELHMDGDPAGDAAVPFQLYDLVHTHPKPIDGCAVNLAPTAIDAKQRCALEVSADGQRIAFKQSGRYTQLFEVATKSCQFPTTDDPSRDAEIAALMR